MQSLCAEERAQASVEAALTVPVLMILLAMLLQPACLLYTKAVMQEAAAEGVRVLVTFEGNSAFDSEGCRSYVKRRLKAVPNIAAFHTGGSDSWDIEVSGDAASDEVSVSIEGRLRPLPILGVLAAMLGESDGDEVVLHVEVSQAARPSWLQGTYSSWVEAWE